MVTSKYDEEFELTRYVGKHYQHLFSPNEQFAAKAVLAEDKANSSSRLAMAKLLRER
ncbi:hypothetical protein [Pseudoduganella sp. HUAS MS19]